MGFCQSKGVFSSSSRLCSYKRKEIQNKRSRAFPVFDKELMFNQFLPLRSWLDYTLTELADLSLRGFRGLGLRL